MAASSCLSQVTIKLYPSRTPTDGSIPAACIAASESFHKQLAILPQQPQKWDVWLVCDDRAWVDLMERIYGQPGLNVYGVSDPVSGLTFLRGSVLLDKVRGVTPQQLVAHEAAHVILRTTSEPAAERQAKAWTSMTVAAMEAR